MTITKIFKSKFFWLFLIFALFLLVRLPGLDLSYHQDEITWSGYASAGLRGLDGIPHPPLSGLFFISAFQFFGSEHLRYLPFVFGMINFWLIFFLVRYKFSWNAALWSMLFFSVGFYSVLASLMIDTDGQILPFFFLLSVISFYKWRDSVAINRKILWGGLLVLSMLLGFLTKASFIIAAGAIIFEFLYLKSEYVSCQKFIKTVLKVAGALLVLAVVIIGILYLLPNLNIYRTLNYWKHFVVFSGRNYLQISIQFLKALLYASPLLLVPLLFLIQHHFCLKSGAGLKRDLAQKLRLFIIFLVFGLIFYLVLFDFSSGALDRYFQFVIVPLSVISGIVVSNIFEHRSVYVYSKYKIVLLGCAVGFTLFLTQFLPHFVPPLYPKIGWFSRVLSLKWNFLFPFTGGSGPMGFYVSWLFVALIWLATIILAIWALIRKNLRKTFWMTILILSFLYNGVFIEEYLFGKINGSPAILLKKTVGFIRDNKDISKVITYNNIGRRELTQISKYERRLYAAPKFESSYTDILKNFRGYYLVIDIPRLSPDSPYAKYFSTCRKIYEESSKKISARIYDCVD